ncbi:GMC family oxidoreductase [Streptomyces sp. ISID311]|nr:GMC family oxidoreductase [Streptomyces sp. ISID311]
MHNKANQILNRGLDRLGHTRVDIARNARDADAAFCGECNSGCLLGCKQSTMKTYLQDASDADALLLPDTEVRRITHHQGRVTGIEALQRSAEGERVLQLHADTVVLAAGALVSPAVLLRSGIGGPYVGHNLHLHPSYFMSGVFGEVVQGWSGQILTSACRDFEQVVEGHGFVVEAGPMRLSAWTGLAPWHDGEEHKRDQLALSHIAGAWGFVRDHGEGRISLDDEGNPVIDWRLVEGVDLAVVRRCHVELARILHAAGAQEIRTFLRSDPRWKDGEDFDRFCRTLGALDPTDLVSTSAHQSGSCTSGPAGSSVTDSRGQLHDVGGVYLADASALPTSPGVNPMIAIMARADQVADYIIADLGASTGSA